MRIGQLAASVLLAVGVCVATASGAGATAQHQLNVPQAQLNENTFDGVNTNADAVSGVTTQPSSSLGWTTVLCGNGGLTVPNATLELDSATAAFPQPEPFPLVAGPSSLGPGDCLQVAPFGQADGGPLVTGYDVARTASPANWLLPPGGGVESVTVRVTVDQPYDALHIQVTVPQSSQGTIEASGITTTGSGFSPPIVNPTNAGFEITVTQGDTYSVTVPIDVAAGGIFKPAINVIGQNFISLGETFGMTASITDNALGGTFLASAGTTVDWQLQRNAGTIVGLAPDLIDLSSTHECKNGGWQSYGVFKNQGDCVSFVTTSGKNQP